MPHVSVIISTFDQPNALTFALLGLQRQTFEDFELVVCDDGSDDVTRRIIEEFRKTSRFPIKHVWQENKGFRKAKIMNEGVRVSEGRTLVFSDGDCIPHREFVRLHAERCTPGSFCVGGFHMLSDVQSAALTRENVARGDHEALITAGVSLWGYTIHVKSLFGLMLGKINKPKIYGRNYSVDRTEYYAVNGLDENHDGFSKEDSDIRNRLRRHGTRPVSLWGRSWVFHVHDAADPVRRVPRIPRTKNWEYYRRKNAPIRCENGLEKLAATGSQ